jgi:hypothetical protein
MLLSPIALITPATYNGAHIHAIHCELSGTYGEGNSFYPYFDKDENQKNTDGKRPRRASFSRKRTTITTP